MLLEVLSLGFHRFKSHKNLSFNFDVFLIIMLVPDLLIIVELVDLAVEVGTWQTFVLIWLRIVIFYMVWVLEVVWVGIWSLDSRGCWPLLCTCFSRYFGF